jgi:RecA-family ATPase
MRFINERRKFSSRSRRPHLQSRFDMKIKVEDQGSTPAQDLNKSQVAIISSKDENHMPLEINADVQKLFPEVKQPETKEENKDKGGNEPEPKVSGGGLKIPPKEPVEISTSFDMSKDEWTLGELLDLNITKIPFLVDKLIPLYTLNVLAGQSERGKSTLYTQLALAIISGEDEFLGCKLSVTYKRVLVISTEDSPIALSFRTNRQLNQVSSVVEFKDRLTFITNQDNLESRIENYLEKNRADLVVMDAFADVFTGGDLNASNSVRRYLNNYVKFIQRFGCTVLFVHHVGKGKQGYRSEKDQLLGSTGIEGKMRNVLMLSIVNDQHQLSIAKGNYINREDKKIPLYLNFDNKTLTFSKADGPAKPEVSDQCVIASNVDSVVRRKPGKQRDMQLWNRVVQLSEEGKTQVAIAKIIGKDKSTICKWLKDYKSKPEVE